MIQCTDRLGNVQIVTGAEIQLHGAICSSLRSSLVLWVPSLECKQIHVMTTEKNLRMSQGVAELEVVRPFEHI